MATNKILGIIIEDLSKDLVLDKIKKYIDKPAGFIHVVSLNPENLVITHEDELFREVVRAAQIKIVDGVGVAVAIYLLSGHPYQRVTGVELMEALIMLAAKSSLRVMLIGAKPNLALKLADCYSRKYPSAKFIGLEGIKDINNPAIEEENKIFSIVAGFKPHLVFTSFGSPYQEIWFWKNRTRFKGIVCIGVGGAFDYLSGQISRPPLFIRRFGFEWLFRLIREPWRFRRQLRIFKFLKLVIQERIVTIFS